MSPVIVRFDGIQESMDGDNLCFTVMSHFVGAGGRDYFKSSWIGVASLVRIGLDLTNVQVTNRGDI